MAEKMTRKVFAMVAVALFVCALLIPSRAGAIEVKKLMPGGESAPSGGGGGGGGGSAPNPMSKAQQQALSDAVSSDSEQFVDQESEKKSSGEAYVDLEHAKPHIFPSGGNVTVKLQAAAYKAKGKKTGEEKALVFKYKSKGNSYVLDGDPTWEDANAATAKAK
jgi:hypothetical protein